MSEKNLNTVCRHIRFIENFKAIRNEYCLDYSNDRCKCGKLFKNEVFTHVTGLLGGYQVENFCSVLGSSDMKPQYSWKRNINRKHVLFSLIRAETGATTTYSTNDHT